MNLLKEIKTSFFQIVFQELNQKREQCEYEISQLKESKAADTKSSMGDKYETSSEMIQQEIARWLSLQKQTEIQLQQLEKIQYMDARPQALASGSLFQTQYGYFFLGVSVGKTTVDAVTIYTLSLQSPLGKLFLGKQKREKVVFQTQVYEIIDFY